MVQSYYLQQVAKQYRFAVTWPETAPMASSRPLDMRSSCDTPDRSGAAGALEVKEGSHSAHEEYWDRVSSLTTDRKAGIGDWYLFEPEASAQLLVPRIVMFRASVVTLQTLPARKACQSSS